MIYFYERQLSSSVNDIEHIESQSLPGVGVVKIFFQPGVDIRTATAQVTSVSQTVLKQMPPGITPPLILNYNALDRSDPADRALQRRLVGAEAVRLRPELHSAGSGHRAGERGAVALRRSRAPDPGRPQPRRPAVQGPVGGRTSAGLSPIRTQIVPAGTAKIGGFEYNIKLNNSPAAIDALNDLPIKTVNGATIYIRDVAFVHDGSPPQRNEVRVNGRRSVLMTILKSGSASTLAIVDGVKALLPKLQETLPPSLHMALLGDQSIFVKAAVSGVVREGVIAAALTSLMILLFLGSWRSTVIIAISIPLAILSSIIMLAALGSDAEHHDPGRPRPRRRHPGG